MKHPKHPAVLYLIYSQISFYTFLVLSVLLVPSGLYDNNGISYYGAYETTIVPFGLAFLSASLLIRQAALALPKHKRTLRIVYYGLLGMIPLLLGVMITPYTAGPGFSFMHKLFAIFLFFEQLAFSFWITANVHRNAYTKVLFIIQFIAGVIMILSLMNKLTFMIEAEILFEVIFGILVVRALSFLLEEETKEV